MISWYKKFIFSIISAKIFSRRFLVYKRVDADEYYVKTRKLFTKPVFIKITGNGWNSQRNIAYKKKEAKRICKMKSMEEVNHTITQSSRYYRKPRLEFDRIYL